MANRRPDTRLVLLDAFARGYDEPGADVLASIYQDFSIDAAVTLGCTISPPAG